MRVPFEFAEVTPEGDVLRHVQVLIGEEEDLVVQQQAADGCGLVRAGLRQRQIVDLGAQGPGEAYDSMTHGSFSCG